MADDFYETLQVHPRADADAIDAAYARLRELYDPARLDGAAEELAALAREKRDTIERAYAVIGDPIRRAAYDAEQAVQQKNREPRTENPETIGGSRSSVPGSRELVVRQERAEELLDYRPLPPAKRQERPRGFDDQPARMAVSGREPAPRAARWTLPIVLFGALALVVAISVALTGGQATAPAQITSTPTPAPFDQLESLIPQARDTAAQNPRSAQSWIDLGNVLYDSVQVVRENAPDSPLYQQRIGRWLEATNAYSQALALEPDNAVVRADMGASSCFYGAGAGDQSYVQSGIAEVRRAAESIPNDPRVLLSLGQCLVSTNPPDTEGALASWRKIIAQDAASPLAAQAQQLVARYAK